MEAGVMKQARENTAGHAPVTPGGIVFEPSREEMVNIVCPDCSKNYAVDVRRIPADATMVRCKSCGTRFPLQVEERAAAVRCDAKPQEQGTRSIGVMISKGGVGKTTTAVNLAAGLSLAGKKVLLVDTDTQGQVTYLLGLQNDVGLADVIYGDKEPQDAVVQARDNLWVLSGGKSLAGVKRVIDRKDFGGENTFSEILTPMEKDYDFIIVDSSPGWDTLTVNVLFYVREVLAPVSLEVMTLQGLKEFLKSLSAVSKYNKDVCLKYIVPTFLDNRIRQPKEILDGIKELYAEKCCPPIRYNVRLSQAPAAGKTIFEFSPDSHGAADYKELVRMVTGEANLFT